MTELYNKYLFELPIIPAVVSQIISIPTNSDISSNKIEDILKVDPYLTSRILKIANSSIYSRQRQITSIKEAVTLVGLNRIKTMCLLIAGSEIIENKSDDFYNRYWDEAINTAFIAKSLATETGKTVISEDIFTAGILHNIGQAILYNFSNIKYDIIQEKLKFNYFNLEKLEKEEFGVDNHIVASGVLKSWLFPQLHIDVVTNYLKTNIHSKFQCVSDTISFAKLLNLLRDKTINKDNELLLTYQSRLNIRKSRIDYYLTDFFDELNKSSFYELCHNTVTYK